MSEKQLYFNPYHDGVAVFLGNTGAQIMELLWRHKNLTVKQIQFYLTEKKLAYTTVMTILKRFLDKKLIQKDKNGKFLSYSAIISKEKLIENYTKLVLDGLKKAKS